MQPEGRSVAKDIPLNKLISVIASCPGATLIRLGHLTLVSCPGIWSLGVGVGALPKNWSFGPGFLNPRMLWCWGPCTGSLIWDSFSWDLGSGLVFWVLVSGVLVLGLLCNRFLGPTLLSWFTLSWILWFWLVVIDAMVWNPFKNRGIWNPEPRVWSTSSAFAPMVAIPVRLRCITTLHFQSITSRTKLQRTY